MPVQTVLEEVWMSGDHQQIVATVAAEGAQIVERMEPIQFALGDIV